MESKITIIGGSGFIGSALCKRLINKVEFSIVDKKISYTFPDKTSIADVRNIKDLKNAIQGESIIINLAAEHKDNVMPKSLYADVNINGAKNICAIAKEKNVQTIIFTSSVAVYGFAPNGTDENGKIAPFNEYGKTKYEAEEIFRLWQDENPKERTLVIIRPTVVFGEKNRGNVYNLLKQIASGQFLMIGDGKNRKSMAYVENLAAFIEYSLSFEPGFHLYNYVDKPDYSMNDLVMKINKILGRPEEIKFRIPSGVSYLIGRCFDLVSYLTKKKFTISSIRIKKFCTNSVFNTDSASTGFVPPMNLEEALHNTVHYEFIASHDNDHVFYSE